MSEKYHDPNDRLIKDKDGLINAIADAEGKVSNIKSPAEIAKEEYLNSSVAQSMSDFKAMISASSTRPRLSTGFKGIDDSLDGGLYTGLYIIGAISSLGKTTLTSNSSLLKFFGNEPTTSANPPVLINGTHSDAANKIFFI